MMAGMGRCGERREDGLAAQTFFLLKQDSLVVPKAEEDV